MPKISGHSTKPSGIPIAEKSSSLPKYRSYIWCTKAAKWDGACSLCKRALDPEAKSKLRAELERCFQAWRREYHGKLTKSNWTSSYTTMFKLERPSAPPRAINYWDIRNFCNKPTAVYWAPTAQINGHCPMLLYGCIYKQWYRYYDSRPNMDFEHFFANSIQITSKGPKTIIDILQAHKSLCDQASWFMSAVAESEAQDKSWRDFHHYKLLPVYRVTFVLLDNLGLDSVEEEPEYFVLDEESQRQNALIVLTGDDSGLSAPVTFDSIRAQSLPIGRGDAMIYGDVQVVRVSLSTAVRFILDLEQREEAAFPSRCIATDRSLGPPTDNISFGTITATEWADEVLQKVDDKGLANVTQATLAVQKIQARERGECREVGFEQFSSRWKY